MNAADWSNIGASFYNQREYEKAFAAYTRTPAEWPDHNINIARCLAQMGSLPDALAYADLAIQRLRYNPEAYGIRAYILERMGKSEEARESYSKALELNPNSLVAYRDCGNIERVLGNYESAKTLYRTALSLNPADFTARLHLSMVQLLLGEWDEGLNNYEIRMATHCPLPMNGKPVWDGSPLAGKRIALYVEQGLGDTIQFARYAGSLKREFGADRVLLFCQDPLYRLMFFADGLDVVVSQASTYSDYDVMAPVMSLPYLMRKAGRWDGPSWVPYLSGRVGEWKPSGRIGVCWKGNPRHPQDNWRSLGTSALRRLTTQSQFPIVSLQFGEDALAREMGMQTPYLTDLLDVARLILTCDWVVTVDTAIAHLVGSLGVPVVVLVPPSPDWRWGHTGNKTAWYPSMHLLRGEKQGDWGREIEKARIIAGMG